MSPSKALGLAIYGSPIGGKDYIPRVMALSPLAYWPLNEKSGSTATDISGNGYNGTYNFVGGGLGQPGIGDGNVCPEFDGTNDYANVFSAGLQSAFPSQEGSLMIWDLPDPASFNDSDVGYLFSGFHAQTFVRIRHTGNNANLEFDFGQDIGEVDSGTASLAVNPTVFQCLMMTWSVANNRVRYYRNGAFSSTADVGIVALANLFNTIVIGADNLTPDDAYFGRLAHCAIFAKELSIAEALSLGVL